MAQHSTKAARFQAITANRLSDGEVVYFTAAGSWVGDFSQAHICDGKAAAQALLTKAMPQNFEQHILDPYLFEVHETDKGFVPASRREHIRAQGPSIELSFIQAEG